mgnify:CR=1 FL=1
MAKRTGNQSIPKVGSRVMVTFGGKEVAAIVIEDRGPLGVGGRRLLRVRLDFADEGDAIEFELPAADVQIAA